MDTVRIYERVLLGDCLDELKGLRDDDRRGQWYAQSASSAEHVLPSDLCVISDRSELDYEYAIQRSREVLYRGIVNTIELLIKEYGVKAAPLPCGVTDAKVFKAFDKSGLAPHEDYDSSQAFALVISRDGVCTLYVFKRFGLGEYWPNGLVDYVREQVSATEARFVSLVDEGGHLDKLNGNENDPARGVKSLSLRQFFDVNFSPEEYGVFRKYLAKLAEEARFYYGYRVVRSLGSNTAYLFRREVEEAISSFDYCSADETGRLSAEQRELLDSQFFGTGKCEALTGTSDFASSFMTAEWLYQSLSGSDRIDLAPIVMDYYKAIEQYLFQFLCLHTKDVDGVGREVYVLKKRETPMTSKKELLSLRDKITLSGLVGFFGYRNKRGDLKRKNDDLLRQGINEETYALIVDELESILEDRNGYFHKDNLYEWREVERARKKTFLIFYLLLGAYEFSSSDENALDMGKKLYDDDFNMLCYYVNECSHRTRNPRRLPIFYLNGNYEEKDALVACTNTRDVCYDENCWIPKYPGVRFKHLVPSENEEVLLSIEQVDRVEQGELVIGGTSHITFELTLPEKTIYENGKYLLGKST